MKPQDLTIALALCGEDPPDTYAALGAVVGLSTSEAHGAVKRLREAGLVDAQRRVLRRPLYEFLRYGIRVVFPVVPSTLSLGVPTGAAVFPDEEALPEPEAAGWVWPDAAGTHRGLAVAPLYPSLPGAVVAHPWLHELFALVDLLRAGRAREVSWARQQLRRRLGIEQAEDALDLSAPDALRRVFGRSRVAFTISKWLRERRRAPPVVQHPLTGPLLAGWRDELAHQIAADVPGGRWSPSPAAHIVGEKADGGSRDWAFPCIVDAIVGRRLIDELEPHIRRGDDGRVFVARSRTSSRRDAGEYDGGMEWTAFLESLHAARLGFGFALKTDVREFFATVDHGLARQIVAQRTNAHPQVVDLLFASLAAWMPSGHLASRGLPIEPHDVSRLVAHALLKIIDDEFEDSFELRYRRFMDDTVMFCESPAEARSLAERHRRVLLRYGLQPNLTKVEVPRAEELLQRLDRREQAARLLEQLSEGDAVGPFAVLESRTSAERVGEERSVFWGARRRRLTLPPERVLDAVGRPEVRDAALAWLETQVIESALLTRLFERFEDLPADEGRLRFAHALGRADVRSTDELLRWALDQAPRAESPWLATALALLVFKHGREEEVRTVTDRAPVPGSVRRLLRGAFADHEQRWFDAPPTQPDEAWAHLALDALVEGRVPRWRALVAETNSRPEHLPLLHWLSRTCPADQRATLRDRLGRLQGDAAVMRHVQHCLDRVQG